MHRIFKMNCCEKLAGRVPDFRFVPGDVPADRHGGSHLSADPRYGFSLGVLEPQQKAAVRIDGDASLGSEQEQFEIVR